MTVEVESVLKEKQNSERIRKRATRQRKESTKQYIHPWALPRLRYMDPCLSTCKAGQWEAIEVPFFASRCHNAEKVILGTSEMTRSQEEGCAGAVSFGGLVTDQGPIGDIDSPGCIRREPKGTM